MEDLDDDFHAADNAIDLARIHDDIVQKVIIRLQATHNRPHIVKELAGILLTELKIVQQYVPTHSSPSHMNMFAQ